MQKTERIVQVKDLLIVPMEEAHALALRHWGWHRSNLYREYNYGDLTEAQLRTWYRERNNRTNRYFTILKDETVRGFIGLKEISFLRKRAVLGFAVDKNLEGSGIGGTALRAFLPVYFSDMGFSSMDLFVYAYNERAIRLYQKLGFQMINTTMDLFRNPENFPTDEEMREFGDAFYQIDGGVYAKVYQMRLRAHEVGRIE